MITDSDRARLFQPREPAAPLQEAGLVNPEARLHEGAVAKSIAGKPPSDIRAALPPRL